MIIAVNPLITIALTQIAPLIGWNWILADPLGVSGILGAALVVAGIVATIRPPSRPKVQKTRL
jgi:drug/metabolite transporter (DMT)-like permease